VRLAPALAALGVAILFLAPAALAHTTGARPAARPPGVLAPAIAPDAAPTSSVASCSTPSSTGTWGTGGLTGFFQSVKVGFYVPNDPGLSGTNFNVTPCSNTIPTYVNGFWMNISTNVPLSSAYVTVWGTTWQLPYQQYAQPIPNFSPGAPYDTSGAVPQIIPMFLNPPLGESASFFFNDYKNFWPGSTVYFNLSVTALNASPSTLYSSNDPHHTATLPAGTNDLANWNFTVASPWTSNNFSQDIQVTTTPATTGTNVFAPNPDQPLQITLTAINIGTGTTLSIPEATINISVDQPGNNNASYQVPAGPANHSVENVVNSATGKVRTIGPFQGGSNISIVVAAWVPWEGGVIDRIYSHVYNFTWSTHGGFASKNNILEDNLVLTTNPDKINSTASSLPTMTPVNVTIHEKQQNITIGSASVQFQYHDLYGEYSGFIPMIAETDNTSYALIPGLPAGGNLTFSVLAKDINNNIVASSNYSYFETGPLEIPPAAGTGFLFFEAVDLATGNLYPNLPFLLVNSTWSEHANGTPLGYGGIRPPAGLGFLPLAYGNYTLTVYANGQAQTAQVSVHSISGKSVVFYFTSQNIAPIAYVTPNTFSIAATVGLIAAALAVIPLRAWFVERRKKAEREQKRISL
jgi:hypothetical protein